MFNITNLRSGNTIKMNSEQFKNAIIQSTKCCDTGLNPKSEGTETRPSIIKKIKTEITSSIEFIENIYIVTAIKKYNNNPQTRYLILIDEYILEEHKQILLDIIKDHITIILVENEENDKNTSSVSFLSRWFRENMGNGFSFIDIDFILYSRQTQKPYIIEEKTTNSNLISFGQFLSYKELLNDVLKVDCSIIFIFISSSIRYIKSRKEELNNKTIFQEESYRFYKFKEEKISYLNEKEELIDFLNNL
ncbi:hypothetical protein M3D73_03990 [Staphylococcus epidermidis]|uniref:hypothetical protein n=1 Tax=Staphylococcus epidermidis TaxID=1282 RepID=UPI0021A9694E|nr:hypothetical protein [Staphylococcus epidermidis]MCT2094926.1 hypothetical protein [Staphylococcus epidermidis]MCT2125337.1 hypothetical protein [Staphylococcus epidermidis]MCT2210699.1 hypothetical protein [Staphylococcus epidermidis]